MSHFSWSAWFLIFHFCHSVFLLNLLRETHLGHMISMLGEFPFVRLILFYSILFYFIVLYFFYLLFIPFHFPASIQVHFLLFLFYYTLLFSIYFLLFFFPLFYSIFLLLLYWIYSNCFYFIVCYFPPFFLYSNIFYSIWSLIPNGPHGWSAGVKLSNRNRNHISWS